ncbi:MAG TPA: hypothetical protein VH164_06155 [Ktedonobacteraceae bacterium]|jgi:hypothetical protein|nr:hypothetical protein [Ktedonobacteraceae bacterium]
MEIGRGEQKEEGQARTPTDERMHPEASQKRTRMLRRSMTIGGIRISATRLRGWERYQ